MLKYLGFNQSYHLFKSISSRTNNFEKNRVLSSVYAYPTMTTIYETNIIILKNEAKFHYSFFSILSKNSRYNAKF